MKDVSQPFLAAVVQAAPAYLDIEAGLEKTVRLIDEAGGPTIPGEAGELVVVRARRIQGGDADTVIKLRPVDPSTIDPELRRSAAFKVEVDVMPGGFVCSASYKGVCTGKEVLDVTAGTMPLRKLFSKEQRAFYDAHAPAGITMDKLVILGPTFLLKSKHQPKDFDRPIVVEMWLYPDGARVLEVSTKCLPKEAFEFGGQFKAYLATKGIVLGADQSAKTKSSLEYFSARFEADQPVEKSAKK